MSKKIQSREQLASTINQAKVCGKTVVSTNGCFDVLHVGHLRYLQLARELGDLLVVGINSDASVRALKGRNRPIQPAGERAEIVAGLECVDYVTVFSELDPIALLAVLKPDIHVKGGNYAIEEVVERQVVEANGGKVVLGLQVPGKSTTDLIKSIREKAAESD